MARTQKIKVVIEVEVTEENRIMPLFTAPQRPDRASSTPAETAEQQQLHTDKVHAQTLLTALQANHTLYAEYVKTLAVFSLDIMGMQGGFAGLAHLRDSYGAGLTVLEEVVSQLPPAAQAHFQQFIEEGLLSEGTLDVYDAIRVTPISLTVEYPVRPA